MVGSRKSIALKDFFLVTALMLWVPLLRGQGLSPGSVQSDERYVGFSIASIRSEAPMEAAGPKVAFSTGSFSAFVGVKWGRMWGAELSLDAYGNFPISDGITTWQRDVTTSTVSGLVRFPLGGLLSLYGRVGVAYWSATQGSSGDNLVLASASHTGSGVTPQFGVGLTLDLGRRWSVRFEGGALVKVLDARVTRVGGGLAYHF
jgi:hypothetical protein